MFNLKHLLQSSKYAVRGLRYVWHNEQNFRIQISLAIMVIVAMLLLQVPLWQAIILFMLIIFVLVLEVANTVVEKLIDLLNPRLHSYVGMIKDMMAAIVLIAVLGSLLIGLIIFLPLLLELLRTFFYN